MVIGSLSGVIRGRTIELDDDVDMPDGAAVKVLLVPLEWRPGDGLRASAGAWRDLSEEDYQRWLAETYQARDDSSRNLP